ncbi:thioesterase domain-containing protein [Streptomyces sp. NPDC056670]|uniref:thioesterase domain-containing protein n=1 Tax=Streptomyces sp. NPDC056670 TaxID=3345904 RepID=UPI00367BDBAF
MEHRDGRTAAVTLAERSYLPMLPGTRRTTFVFVHPVGGSVSGYVDVLAALPPDTPCVGLRARGLGPAGEPHRNVPAMARRYLAELGAHHAPEDLVLTGYSFGGLVALEMAAQLEAVGRRPAGTVLLGTWFPLQDVPRVEHVATFRGLVSAIYRIPRELLELEGLSDAAMVAAAAAAARDCPTLPAEYRSADLNRLFGVLAANLRMTWAYRVPHYGGPVHLVRPERPGPRDDPGPWSERCTAGVVTHDVGGEHNSLMTGAHGERIADVLATCWPD